jgi:invasion protein IalB
MSDQDNQRKIFKISCTKNGIALFTTRTGYKVMIRKFLVLLPLLLVPIVGSAQQVSKDYKDWRLICSDPANGTKTCSLIHLLTRSDTGVFLAEVTLRRLDITDGQHTVMALTVPSNVLLRTRPGYTFSDTRATQPLEWYSCTPQVCTATKVLSSRELRALRKGLDVIFGYQPLGQTEPMLFKVSLRGITAGLEALNREAG